jgi:hypothetical protein
VNCLCQSYTYTIRIHYELIRAIKEGRKEGRKEKCSIGEVSGRRKNVPAVVRRVFFLLIGITNNSIAL